MVVGKRKGLDGDTIITLHNPPKTIADAVRKNFDMETLIDLMVSHGHKLHT